MRSGIVVFALFYLVTVWLDGVGSNFPARVTPRAWLYFCQIAALFKSAGMMSIDYRAEGWSCADRKWIEVDVHPWFKVDSDNKENRFHRALQFYRKERKVMRALDEYVVKRNNATPSLPKIGGVRFLSLRIPYPKLGSHVEPVDRKPLADYPEDMRHNWYWSPGSMRRDRCGDAQSVKDDDEKRDDKNDELKGEGKSESKSERRDRREKRSRSEPPRSLTEDDKEPEQ